MTAITAFCLAVALISAGSAFSLQRAHLACASEVWRKRVTMAALAALAPLAAALALAYSVGAAFDDANLLAFRVYLFGSLLALAWQLYAVHRTLQLRAPQRHLPFAA